MNLYITATPIGNLEDITLRALRIFKEVDFILAEDTRVTKKILNHYEVNTKTISYHEHSDENKMQEILDLLLEGKNLALVTDAGTPGISDPCSRLLNYIRERDVDNVIKIQALPGPSALIAAVSISGIKNSQFVFLGFPPNKKGRETFFKQINEYEIPVFIYESRHRIVKALEKIKEFCPNKKTKIFKEISKMNENYFSGDIDDLINLLTVNKDLQRGEFVILIE